MAFLRELALFGGDLSAERVTAAYTDDELDDPSLSPVFAMMSMPEADPAEAKIADWERGRID